MLGDIVLVIDVFNDYEYDVNMFYVIFVVSEKLVCVIFRNCNNILFVICLFDLVLGGEGIFFKKFLVIFGGCFIVLLFRFGWENFEILIDVSKMGLISDIVVVL